MTHVRLAPRTTWLPSLLPVLFLSVLLACGGGGGGDGTKQLGNNLDFEPTNLVTCGNGYPIQTGGTFPNLTFFGGSTSCVLLTFFPGAQPNADGRAVRANIRIGQFTGPMRFIKMRVLYNRVSGVACCALQQYGDVFTPAANSITSVNINFRMVEDHIPAPSDLQTIAANDLVGLEILSQNVPIPGVWVNNGAPQLDLPDYLWYPSFTAQGIAAPSAGAMISSAGLSGFLPSFNIDFAASDEQSVMGPE